MALKLGLDLDERNIERHQPPTASDGKVTPDADIIALATAVAAARAEATALVTLESATERDGSLTPEGRALTVATAAVASADRVAPRLDAARSRVLASIASIQKATSAPPAPTTQSGAAMEQEIRAALRSMPDKDRKAALESAFANADAAILGAVLRAPSFLAGMGEAAQGMIRHRYQKQFHPVEVARIERLQKALEAHERAGKSFVALMKAASSSEKARLAASNAKRRAEAAAAHAALSEEQNDG
jgi:hypothetical protein